MRRTFVAKGDAAALILFALGLAFQQQLHTARQQRDFAFLTGDHLGQVIDGAGQVGDLFFKGFHGAI